MLERLCVREFDKNAVVINGESRKQIIYGLENTFCVSGTVKEIENTDRHYFSWDANLILGIFSAT